MEPIQEKRNFKRIPIERRLEIAYRLMNPRLWAEARSRGVRHVKDVSLGGISFQTEERLPPNSLVSMRLDFSDEMKTGDIYGRIVRVSQIEENNSFEVGINFSWWGSDDDKKRLAGFIENL